MSKLQKLLDSEARLSNAGKSNSPERRDLHIEIKKLRGTVPPPCHGQDDCSTLILSTCPWRIDCGPTDE